MDRPGFEPGSVAFKGTCSALELPAPSTFNEPIGLRVTDEVDDQVVMAKLAFAAYCKTVDNKNVAGQPIPSWEQLGDSIQAAWVAGANAVAAYLEGPPAADDLAD